MDLNLGVYFCVQCNTLKFWVCNIDYHKMKTISIIFVVGASYNMMSYWDSFYSANSVSIIKKITVGKSLLMSLKNGLPQSGVS
ncbi:hypothetical protein T05_16408 [Trichinella murrelli]|uniref:Uncharacterized protein n=1 Tax=Trichinella murrelli TaxID=144512 RepID=A0A0V0UD50_9BILA|nr:hypothetical protein T05_16408 [Trichinella murrelli]